MRPLPIRRYVLLAALPLACREAPRQQDLTLTDPQPPASLLRLPREGGVPQVYRMPALDESVWQAKDRVPHVRSVVGADIDGRLVYALGDSNEVLALDLENGRLRRFLSRIRAATVGPDGALYAVNDSGRITSIERRNPVRFTDALPTRPRALFGTLGDEVIAVLTGKPARLVRLNHDQQVVGLDIASGEAAATMWGDLVAVAADSAVVLYEARSDREPRVIPVSGHAKSMVFSASGHRLFVARERPSLLQFDRFSAKALAEIDLPGQPEALRSDPLGRWLLVRPVGMDSVWAVDLARGHYMAAWSTRWADDLPAVAAGRFLLVRQGQDVVGYDLLTDLWPETGRVRGGNADLWLPLAWAPGPQSSRLGPDTTVAPPPDTSGRRVYLQVSSSQNPDWAQDLAQKLREAGVPASIIKPRQENEAYRVVIGPYPSREDAETEGRKLGRPFFIYQEEAEH